MTTQQQREAFEAWFKNEFGRPSKPAREGASYAHPMAFSAWRAWQAAQAQQGEGEPVAYLVERIKGDGYSNPRRIIDAAKYDPRKDSFWADEAKERHRVTPLYAHPQPGQQVPEQ